MNHRPSYPVFALAFLAARQRLRAAGSPPPVGLPEAKEAIIVHL
jgi:hypothetical protein